MTFSLRVLIFFVVAFYATTANGLDSRTRQALEQMGSATSDADLVVIAKRFTDLRGSLVLWRGAVAMARSEIGNKPHGRAATVRLLRLALIVDSDASKVKKWSVMKEPIDTLTQEDINALRRATSGFPHKNDSIIYLLARKPSLRSKSNSGEYTVIRTMPDSAHSVVLERSTVPFMDLGPAWMKSKYDIDSDPVQVAAGEHGQTRRYSLKGLPDIVLAAKAFRTAENAPPHQRGYAAYVASEALARGLRAFGFKANQGDEAGFLSWSIHQWALEQIVVSSEDTVLENLAQQLRFKLPSAAFSARAFPEAADAYGKIFKAEPERRLWAAWGEGISYFAAGNQRKAAVAFERIIPLLPKAKNATQYAYILLTFLQKLPENERTALGDLTNLSEATEKKLASIELAPDQVVSMDLDFAKIMVIIGRTDLGLAHMAQRLDSVESLAEDKRNQIETRYLRELGAFTRDLCYDISWSMSSSAGWKVRSAVGYPTQLDFLHNLKDNGELTGHGEVITFKEGTPYGMLSPEEDCAMVSAVYGVNLQQVIPEPATVLGISKWALSALNRKTPRPSLAPYLKLVWVEWFLQQFESLTVAGISAQNFVYLPQNISGVTDPQKVAALKSHPAATAHQRALIDTFLSVRELLERRYFH